MRDIICLVLTALLFSTTTLEARAAAVGALPVAQTESKGNATLKQRMLEVQPGTMIEVRLLNKQKIRGRLGELTDEGFTLTTARGEKISTQKVAFTEVNSFKKVEASSADYRLCSPRLVLLLPTKKLLSEKAVSQERSRGPKRVALGKSPHEKGTKRAGCGNGHQANSP